jgi:hypothetical protein
MKGSEPHPALTLCAVKLPVCVIVICKAYHATSSGRHGTGSTLKNKMEESILTKSIFGHPHISVETT